MLQEEAGDDPQKRTELVRSILSSLALVQDSILRSFYVKECARLLDMEERTLIMELNKMFRQKQIKERGGSFRDEVPPVMPSPPVAKKEKKLDSKYVEEDILRKLLQYGSQQIVISILNEKEEKEDVDISVAEYILFELENDEIDFRHEQFGRLMQEIRTLDLEQVPALQHRFLNHSSPEIAKTTTDLLISQHELSKGWQTHRIFTEMEDRNPEVLEETITNSVIALKLRNIELMLEDIDKELKDIHDESKLSDDELILMNKKIKLNKARIYFSSKLTRVFSH